MLLALYLCAITCCFLRAVTVVGSTPSAESPRSAREVDALLQEYAFRGFHRPKTGVVYDGSVPSNLTGVRVAALRLRSGSLRRKGFSSFKEFDIPVGLVEQPYVERLALVYHNLGNWTSPYYPLPGYTFLAPVLGLLAYDAAVLSATGLSELDIRASGDPVSIRFPSDVEYEAGATCVCFAVDGSIEFNSLVRGNSTCSTTKQGHFSIVARTSVAPSPAPSGSGGGTTAAGSGGRKGKDSKKAWIIAGCVIGGLALLVLLALVFGYVRKCRRRKKVRRMEEAAESGVPLSMTSLGYTKAPVAMETRTRPVLENEFVP